jgi:dihydrofolate reductase
MSSVISDTLSGHSAAPPIELVLAVSENGVIGRGNALPWRLPADLRRFKALTLGRSILMGRKTYESIGRPLPQRQNIVLSQTQGLRLAGCEVAGSVPEALAIAAPDTPLMVIGGANLYAQTISLARRMHLTLVHAQISGDTYFHAWRDADFRETVRAAHAADASNEFAFSTITLERWRAPAL